MEKEDKRPEWGRKCGEGCLVPQRIAVALLGFFALLFAYTNRISISHVIVELVVPKLRTNVTKGTVCPGDKSLSTHKLSDYADRYRWSEELQGFILGSFYIGYIITHLPGGILADRFGAKWVLAIGMLISALTTCLTPVAIMYGHEWGLVAIRIIMGLAQGPLFPAMTTLLSHWVPKKERGTLGTICYSGVTAGTVSSNLGSGLMLHSMNWPICLYVFGSLTILWVILFVIICYSSPSLHPWIRTKEKIYLEEQIPMKAERPPIPWKKLLFNKPLAATIVAQIGHDWGYYVMITCLPKFMADVLGVTIRSNGIMTSLPFVAMFISSISCGFLTDWLIRTGRMSINLERKLFNFIGAIGPGGLTVAASYAGCDVYVVVALFVLAMFTMGAYYVGQKLSPMDMSPTFSGTITAICNGLGSLAGLAAPPIVGLMTPQTTVAQWHGVFWLGFVILVLSAIVFWIWGTAEIQSYDPNAPAKTA
ncbi:putative inorganic phosphate cotransporter [Drosophila navojoa]|uniref:putative inorganic phosphate cotransporter n=1 Tax=Drosophila navojoa TaxID=7232 RepID=UPI0011BFC4B4|nr:putative inorganic phosphate cotransporter [Drosophila navojoa]